MSKVKKNKLHVTRLIDLFDRSHEHVSHDLFINVPWLIVQAILVSGESGAGKTESTKHLMQQLAAIAGHTYERVMSQCRTYD